MRPTKFPPKTVREVTIHCSRFFGTEAVSHWDIYIAYHETLLRNHIARLQYFGLDGIE